MNIDDDEFGKLINLKKKGLLTDEGFSAAKGKLLDLWNAYYSQKINFYYLEEYLSFWFNTLKEFNYWKST